MGVFSLLAHTTTLIKKKKKKESRKKFASKKLLLNNSYLLSNYREEIKAKLCVYRYIVFCDFVNSFDYQLL